ncbi:helix-turn-helix domain-containing protein [Nocardioides ochotonae]|uniref:helix-turn-helix domain-containing protein n=1 Tax=Nocardioides ochotonae TaxID=2685869 RepID=UPI00140A93FA|nr:helix-turn-helix transcriptional regulator [Nocardioides ochotonae]
MQEPPVSVPEPTRARQTEIDFGKRVRQFREAQKLSQSKFAELLASKAGLSIDPSAIARIELGDRSVKLGEARAFAEVLGSSVAELVGEDPRQTPVRQIAELRDRANEWMRRSRFALRQMVQNMAEVQNEIRTSPGALVAFSEEEDPPADVEDYLLWVLGRIEQQAAVGPFATAATAEDARRLQLIAEALTAHIVKVGLDVWSGEDAASDEDDRG